MKILSASQIRAADQYTIENEPIASIDLMERASEAFVAKFLDLVTEKTSISVFCGTGNNGGDGLAISRILLSRGWSVSVYVIGNSAKGSNDFGINLDRCENFALLKSSNDFPAFEKNEIIIDAIFGSGLTRPIEGKFLELVEHLNSSSTMIVSVDIASGLFSNQSLPAGAVAVQPKHTISFQLPKLAFFLPSCHRNVGEWHVVPIGLDAGFIENQVTPFALSTAVEMQGLLPQRSKFAHKSEVGRVQLVAGSKGKVGAAALAAKAAFRAGAGLVIVRTPACATSILTSLVTEVMVEEDENEHNISNIEQTDFFVGIGPGIGTHAVTQKALKVFLKQNKQPVVLDADAINIISQDKELLSDLPFQSILTPHPGEFRRLVGDWGDDFEKLERLRSLCMTHQLNVVLKGAYSAVCDSKGNVYFNPTGNAGMATAGSGDVLTGIITALLAQKLQPFDALKLGVYVHGLAGDIAAEEFGKISLVASDIISKISNAFEVIRV